MHSTLEFLGHESDAAYAFFHEVLDFLTRPIPLSVTCWL